MACANPECGCSEGRTTRNGGSYCSEECANHAEVSARSQAEPVRHSGHGRSMDCGCGHAACASPA